MILKISGIGQQNWIARQKEMINLLKKYEEEKKRINPKDTFVKQELPFNRNAKEPVEEFMLELLKAEQKLKEFDKKPK